MIVPTFPVLRVPDALCTSFSYYQLSLFIDIILNVKLMVMYSTTLYSMSSTSFFLSCSWLVPLDQRMCARAIFDNLTLTLNTDNMLGLIRSLS